jgi:hypothetical protein
MRCSVASEARLELRFAERVVGVGGCSVGHEAEDTALRSDDGVVTAAVVPVVRCDTTRATTGSEEARLSAVRRCLRCSRRPLPEREALPPTMPECGERGGGRGRNGGGEGKGGGRGELVGNDAEEPPEERLPAVVVMRPTQLRLLPNAGEIRSLADTGNELLELDDLGTVPNVASDGAGADRVDFGTGRRGMLKSDGELVETGGGNGGNDEGGAAVGTVGDGEVAASNGKSAHEGKGRKGAVKKTDRLV